MHPNDSPSVNKLVLPVLAELVARGDGTFVLKPKRPDADLDTWISVEDAALVIGGIRRRAVNEVLGKYLVYRHVSSRKVLISLRSAIAYKEAMQDAEFWTNPALRRRLATRVNQAMAELKRGACT